MINLSGDGDFIDVRFKIDIKMKEQGSMYLQDEASGKMIGIASVPKVGSLTSLRTRTRKNTGNYAFSLFKNAEGILKPGSLVTFVAGGYKKEHIKVY